MKNPSWLSCNTVRTGCICYLPVNSASSFPKKSIFLRVRACACAYDIGAKEYAFQKTRKGCACAREGRRASSAHAPCHGTRVRVRTREETDVAGIQGYSPSKRLFACASAAKEEPVFRLGVLCSGFACRVCAGGERCNRT